MKIEKGKIFTVRNGEKVRIVTADLCFGDDNDTKYLAERLDDPLQASDLLYLDKDGRLSKDSDSEWDLIKEYSEWSNVKVDDKIESEYGKGHFARRNNGNIMIWKDGKTSFTAKDYNDVIIVAENLCSIVKD